MSKEWRGWEAYISELDEAEVRREYLAMLLRTETPGLVADLQSQLSASQEEVKTLTGKLEKWEAELKYQIVRGVDTAIAAGWIPESDREQFIQRRTEEALKSLNSQEGGA